MEAIVFLRASQTFPNETLRSVDVRDVANAHILAFERSSTSGRYCLIGQVAHLSEFFKILCKQYPTLPLPEKCVDDKPFVPKYEVSKEKAKDLGVDFTPLEVTAKNIIESLKERGFLNF
ncbi:cinnamoyl-CoA reductase CAD2-like [Hevea brasiliensis]|uniref:cinnamoyl-CoA reductase CAD2-like n=1 Tax=Hevea brasiliensis TaxID=3981 RepID=UPI0025E5B127|nr:cinnamoyl-CoA reductase CAD2-like [Hevea brasiliensis]